MRLAVSKDGRRFGKPVIRPTPQSFEVGMKQLKRISNELIGDNKVQKVCGGVAGTFDFKIGGLIGSPLKGWLKKPLQKRLAGIWKAPVILKNDTTLVGLGEATYGAGRGYRIVSYLTVSTGVGGTRIVDRQIDSDAWGFEPGHQIIDIHGRRCQQCGLIGCLQSFIGGRELERRIHRPPWQVKDKKVWEEEARYLATGLINASVFWVPDVIVLGGSMFKQPGISVDRVRYHYNRQIKLHAKPSPIKAAQLGNIGGLWGALVYLHQQPKIIRH